MSEDIPVEVEVRNWNRHSFTINGISDQLEKLFQEHGITCTLSLKQNDRMVQIIRDVRLKGRRDCYFTPELDTTAIENPLYQGTIFEYEDLDNSWR